MKISIVIPTYIRPKYLLQTIQEAIQQSHPAVCEIIVVDQTPVNLITKEFRAQLEELKQRANIIYLYREVANLPAARNAALATAKGEIVIMIDDDVLLPPNFLEEHYSCYTSNRNVACVAGLPYQRNLTCIDRIDDINLDNFPNFTHPHFKETKRDENWTGLIVGANHSVLKKFAINAGGYDETMLGTAYYEDFDFIQRFRKKFPDKTIVYNPSAYVIHLRAMMGGARRADIKTQKLWLKSVSTHIYMWRHTKSVDRRKLFLTTLRVGPLRVDNILKFWKQPRLWYGFVKSLFIGYKKSKSPQSIFIKKN